MTTTSPLKTFWELNGYLGIFAVILAGIGAAFSRHTLHTRCFGIMAIIAVTIMLGSYTPIYHLYYKFLPGIATFRIPARCLIIFVFSMSVFAGFGVQHLCESTVTRKQHVIAMVWSAVLFLCLLVGAKILRMPLTSREMILSIAFFVIAFIILNLSRFLKNKPVIAALIIAALFIELYLIYFSQIPKINQGKILKKSPYELLFEKDPGFYRVASSLDEVVGSDYYYYGINGYAPVALGLYYKFIHEMASLPFLKERHILSPWLFQQDLVFSSKILGIKYAIIPVETKNKLTARLITAQQFMPRALLIKDAVVLPQLEDQLQYIKKPEFDPQKQILLESLPGENAQPAPKITEPLPKENGVTITSYQPNRIELTAVADSSTYLLLSELFYPGWHAYVDGNKVQILRADYLLRAVPLTAGRHNIVFIYRPASFFIGAAMSLSTLLVLVFLWVRNFKNLSINRGFYAKKERASSGKKISI